MNKVHVVKDNGPVISPYLTKAKPTYSAGDTLIVEDDAGLQKAFNIEYVATDKVNKGWCYLALYGPQGLPSITQQPVDDIPASVG